jgi:charged multivesicular body protein 6
MGAFSSKSNAAQTSAAANKISSVDRTMLDMKNTRDRLYRYRSQLERDRERLLQQAQAQKLLNNKTRALGLLRLKKYKQTLLDSVEEQLFTLQQIMSTIDSKQNEQQLLTVLKAGKDCLKELHSQFNVDQVLDLMSEVQETLETEQEINQILSQVPELSPDQEEDAQAELDALMKEMIAETPDNLPQVPSDKPLPDAPTTKLPDASQASTYDAAQSRVALPG